MGRNFSNHLTKKVVVLLSCLFVISITLLPLTAFAENNVEIKASAGFNGEYKTAESVPVAVTITNNGDDIVGKLVLEIKEGQSSGVYFRDVAIAKGTTQKIHLVVPGYSLNSFTSIKLYDDKDRLLDDTFVGGKMIGQETLFIGVLAADADTANFFGSISSQLFPNPIRVKSLTEKDIPNIDIGLSNLDMLIINNYSMDALTKEQVIAIEKWTKGGGYLVLAGGPHFHKAGEPFISMSPVKVTETLNVNQLESITKISDKKLDLNRQLSISSGLAKENSQILFQDGKIPLIAVGEAEAGKVLYVAYDLVEEPLASWSGNRDLWGNVLNQTIGRNYMYGKNYDGDIWPLVNAANQIPSLELPNITTLVFIFGFYILLIGPILYFIMKRKDKREWLWTIVPIVSIVVAYSIYQFGLFRHSNDVLSHDVVYVEIDHNGNEKTKAVSAIFVPQNGDYKINFENVKKVLPVETYYSRNNQYKNTWISFGQEQQVIEFKNVEFWSTRKFSVAKENRQVGGLETELYYKENGKLYGKITNNSPYSLRDAKLMNGRIVEDIGEIKAGQTVEVSLNKGNASQLSSINYNQMPSQLLLPANIKKTPNYQYSSREAQMLEFINNKFMGGPNPNYFVGPFVVGWMDQFEIDYQINDEEIKNRSQIVLVKAELNIIPGEEGLVYYPYGSFKPVLIESTNRADFVGDGWIIQNGSTVIEFQISESTKMDITAVNLYTWSNDRTFFDKKLYNWQTKSFDSTDKFSNGLLLEKDQIQQYVSKDGKIRIEFSHNKENEHRHLGEPAISVEGKVKQ